MRDADRRDHRRPTPVVPRTQRRASRPAVPDAARRTAYPQGDRLAARQAHRHRSPPLPVTGEQRITPHTLRHTNAMLLRAENVDIHTIALCLGHESIKSTEVYLHADNKLKQQAIDRTAPTGTPPGRYRPSDKLMSFLDGL
ncbi:MAG: tyrosine-type recombinase/integrase [Solirubrobacteraceae bacterium]